MASTNDGDWVQVPRKGSRRPPKDAPPRPDLDRTMTVDTLWTSYDRHMKTWRASSCRKELRGILNKKRPDEGWQIQEAVCLASGSFSRDNYECQKRSMLQFVVFMDTVEHVQKTSDSPIRVYADEIVYTPIDVEFLASLRVTARDRNQGPDEKTEIPHYHGPGLLLFELFVEKDASTVERLLGSEATLMIGSTFEMLERRLASPALEPLRELNALWASYHFPRYEEDPTVFEGLKIFWKEPHDEDDM